MVVRESIIVKRLLYPKQAEVPYRYLYQAEYFLRNSIKHLTVYNLEMLPQAENANEKKKPNLVAFILSFSQCRSGSKAQPLEPV